MANQRIDQSSGVQSGTGDFRIRLTTGLINDAFQVQVRNTDHLRFPAPRWKAFRRDLRARWRRTLGKLGFVKRRRDTESAYLAYVMEHLEDFERTYSRLEDETSREIFLAVLRYRALGSRHVALPSNTDEYWRRVESLNSEFRIGTSPESAGPNLGNLARYRIPGTSEPMELDLHPLNVLNTFCLEHYACRHGGAPIEVQPGDVVVDGGGCWGDTAMYFADRVGDAGRVFCFEFVPDNLRVLQANLERNPTQAARIQIVERALWNRSDETLKFDLGAGAGTRVGEGQGGDQAVHTLSIDDLVEREGLDRVDWIKLDVEGAERATLEGARETLARFQPRLAISLYHKPEDFFELPDLIAEILPNHEHRITHITIHEEETVLFAAPRGA